MSAATVSTHGQETSFTINVLGARSKKLHTKLDDACLEQQQRLPSSSAGGSTCETGHFCGEQQFTYRRKRPGSEISRRRRPYEKDQTTYDAESLSGTVDSANARRVNAAFFACMKSQRPLRHAAPSRYFAGPLKDAALEPVDEQESDDGNVPGSKNATTESSCSTSPTRASESSDHSALAEESKLSDDISHRNKNLKRKKSTGSSAEQKVSLSCHSLAPVSYKGYRQIPSPPSAPPCTWFALHVNHIRPSSNQRLCPYCRSFSHPARLCPTLRCAHCGALSHAANECPNFNLVCRVCMSVGHKEGQCPGSLRNHSLSQGSAADSDAALLSGKKRSLRKKAGNEKSQRLCCITCSRKGHACCSVDNSLTVSKVSGSNAPQSEWMYCSHCGLQGHLARTCRRKREVRLLLEPDQRTHPSTSVASGGCERPQRRSSFYANLVPEPMRFMAEDASLSSDVESLNLSLASPLSKVELKQQRKRDRTAIKAKKRRRRTAARKGVLT